IALMELRGGVPVHAAGKTPLWSVEFTARSVMGQHEVASSLNEIPSSGFTVFDIRGFWQVTPNFLVVSGVENLGDKFYRERLDPLFGNLLFRPGVNYYLTLQVTY